MAGKKSGQVLAPVGVLVGMDNKKLAAYLARANHLSFSQLQMLAGYGGCSYQWYLRYVEGISPKPSPAMLIGRAFHSGLEAYYRKIMAGASASVARAAAIRAPGLTEKLTKGQAELARRSVVIHLETLATLVVPAAVERPFCVAIPRAGKWTLDGVIDVFDARGWVIDHKSSGRLMEPDDANLALQPTAYLWAQRAVGEPAQGFVFHRTVTARDGEAIVTQAIQTTRTNEQLDWFEETLREAIRQIEAGIFPRNLFYEHHKRCPKEWRGICMPGVDW